MLPDLTLLKNQSDEQLVQTIGQSGADELFEVLLDRYEKRIYRFLLRAAGEDCPTDFLTQEVFTRVMRQLPSFDGRQSVRTWVYGIARVVVQRQLRDRPRFKRSKNSVDSDRLPAPSAAPPESPAAENIRALLDALETLKENHRTALVLREYEKLEYDEIGKAMGAAAASVKTWVQRAKLQLARELNRPGVKS